MQSVNKGLLLTLVSNLRSTTCGNQSGTRIWFLRRCFREETAFEEENLGKEKIIFDVKRLF